MTLTPEQVAHIRTKWARFTTRLSVIRDGLWRWTRSDAQWVVIILVLAALLRFPFLAHPDRTQFDEVMYANFALRTLHGEPFFDIHPPFARMLYTEMLRHQESFTTHALKMEVNQPFQDIPYVPLRLFTAILGTLLPLIMYMIGRMIGYSPRGVGLASLLLVFDSAFIVYARTFLPDTLLLTLNLLAFAAALRAAEGVTRRTRVLLIVCCGLLLGLALSIKWTALGVFGAIAVIFLLERRIIPIIAVGCISAVVYIAIFVGFFFYFPNGGKVDPLLTAFDTPWIRAIDFPKPASIVTVLRFLPEYHRDMLRANRDEAIQAAINQAPHPLAWATGRSAINFWQNENPTEHNTDSYRQINFQANALIWAILYLLILFELGWISWHLKTTRKWPIDHYETVLLAGYLGNYLPFFLIHRPMYLYHYFTALAFALLLMPRILPRAIECLGEVTHDRLLAQVLAYFILVLMFVNFVILFPTTFGV